MKKLVFLFLFKLFLTWVSYGKQVDAETARAVGLRFLQAETGRHVTPDKISLALIYTAKKAPAEKSGHQRTYFYVFNQRTAPGFLIIAADDVVFPILAYSNERHFDAAMLPPHVAAWLKGYEQEIEYAAKQTEKPAPAVTASWRKLQHDIPQNSIAASATSVKPLLHTRWNQSPFYNAYCPGQSVTGCVATSMAQLLKYWKHPSKGSGAHQYKHPRYGLLSANFEVSGYEWYAMPDSIDRPHHAIAALMYDCGVSVEMDYNPVTSNAYLVASANASSAEHALKKYFDYSKDAKGIRLEDYHYVAWLSIIKSELDSKRPVLYAGFGKGGGHCFITDGYDENDYFHFNWGWGGAYDGYFLLTALNPTGVGIGGGAGGYNNGHQALIGIEPEKQPHAEVPELRFYESPALNHTSINYADAFSVSGKVLNKSVTDFSGDYCAAIFDKNNLFFDYMEIKPGNRLQGGMQNMEGLDFKNSGMPLMLPGTYYIGFFYRISGGKWKPIADLDSTFPLLTLEVGRSNAIELNSWLTDDADKRFIQGEPVALSVNIVNKSNRSFKGEYQLALYYADGRVAEEIAIVGEKQGLPAGATYPAPYLLFRHKCINLLPGSYLLAISYRENGSETWKFAGSGLFQNPVKVIVEAGALTPDAYENNNSPGKARQLPAVFLHHKAVVTVDPANIDKQGDNDYYRVDLPAGFNYTLESKLHDRYNSTNGKPYTLDAVFMVSEDTVNWSPPYDGQPHTLSVKGGRAIYYHVSPYFPGETGDYLLEIEITRTAASAEEVDLPHEIKVYPNPVKTDLFLNLQQYRGRLKSVELHRLNGMAVYKIKMSGSPTQLSIPVANLPAGIYILSIGSEQGRSTQKILVIK